MSTKNYLELDVNKLFEEHKIKEIEEIQKKIQAEVDWKKVELRTLVGERYRDLIQAADTIAEMRTTTEIVVEKIVNIENTIKDLQQKYLIGFKIEPLEETQKQDKNDVADAVIVQIKILMDIPEYIWSAIDDKDLLKASQLFILAQHVNYSLIFEVGQSELALKYPVVTKQWSIISNFRRIIIEVCNHMLQSVDLTPEIAANCLASLVLIEKTKSKDLLEKLINFRSIAVESIIKSESPQSVRHRIKLSVKLLSDTVALIHSCFVNANNCQTGLITHFIKDIMDEEASKILIQLDLSNQIVDKYLPSVTKNHKLFAKDEFIDISLDDLHCQFNFWLSWIKNFTSNHVSRLLNLVTSVRGVYNIREESVAVQLPEYWTNIWRDLGLPIVNFWTEYYHPLLTERVKEIIKIRWRDAVTDLKVKMSDLVGKLMNEKFDYPEHDLQWFVWKDSPTDIPQKLSKTGNLDVKRSLLMKARGYSPNLVNLCESFDENLQLLLADLEQYLYDTEKINSVTEDLLAMNLSSLFDKFNDRSVVQENLQQISAQMIEELICFIKDEYICDLPKHGKCDINVIFMARCLQALISLCPNLNKCFTLSKIAGLTISNVKWQQICDKIKDESIIIWSTWAARYQSTILNDYVNNILKTESVDGLKVETVICEWEKVTIEEEAEDGKPIKSEILVPYQPSTSLAKFLSTVIRDLNKVVPHTIPKKVLHNLIENIVGKIFDYYAEVSKSLNLRQKQAFQVMLDVKYVTLLMVPRENKVFNDKSVELCNKVQEKIDPFDSDVFYPFIHVNVKRSVQRTVLIYGILVPHLEQLYSVLGSRSELNDTEKSIANPPGVLAVCTGAPWFSPLAVTAPSRNLPLISVTMPDKAQRKKTMVKEHTRSDSTGASIKSGAAAFFGAMGSDWFSTS